jgi:hypothetical protein
MTDIIVHSSKLLEARQGTSCYVYGCSVVVDIYDGMIKNVTLHVSSIIVLIGKNSMMYLAGPPMKVKHFSITNIGS